MRDDSGRSGSSGYQIQDAEWRALSFLASCRLQVASCILHLATSIFENIINVKGELISTVCPKENGLASWTDRI